MSSAIKRGALGASFTIFGIFMSLTATVLLASSSKLATAVSGGTIISLMNNERQAAGMGGLSYNSKLSSSAYAKAQDMCAKHYWAHNAPDGTTPWTFVDAAGYQYTEVAENLAQGFTDDSALVAGWMASPGHRANILHASYRDVGVASLACNLVGTETTLVVAHFGATAAAAAPAPKPVVAAPVAAKPQPVAAVAASPAPAVQAAQTAQPVAPPQPAAVQAQPTKTVERPSFIATLLKELKSLSGLNNFHFLSRLPLV